MRKFFLGITALIIVMVIGFLLSDYQLHAPAEVVGEQSSPAKNYKEAVFVIENQPVRLGGDTKYFGNEVRHDFDGDGREDVAFLITHQPGGSGTFYYLVAVLNTEKGYVGSHGAILGDRIAPQTTELLGGNLGKGNIIVVNYADRAYGESFSTPPSIGKTIWLLLDPENMQFGEVVQNFEGESAYPDARNR